MKKALTSLAGVAVAALATLTAPIARAAPATAVSNCTSANVAVTLGHEGAGMGHVGVFLLFTNTSTSVTCAMHGYPTASYGLSDGTTLTAAKILLGWTGGVSQGTTAPGVILAPGQQASAIVEWTDIVNAGQQCYSGISTNLRITPPGMGKVTTLSVGTPCGNFEVHPVVPGTSGDY